MCRYARHCGKEKPKIFNKLKKYMRVSHKVMAFVLLYKKDGKQIKYIVQEDIAINDSTRP